MRTPRFTRTEAVVKSSLFFLWLMKVCTLNGGGMEAVARSQAAPAAARTTSVQPEPMLKKDFMPTAPHVFVRNAGVF